jgi:hypothetical protein
VILHFEFRADVDRWRVRLVETGFVRDDANLMAYDARGKIASIGERAREFRTDAARVVPIYDALRFDPVGAANSVRYYTMLAHQEVRHGVAHVLDLLDRYELILELPGYSGIAAGLRDGFEKELYAMTFVRSYSINGHRRRLPWNLLRRR